MLRNPLVALLLTVLGLLLGQETHAQGTDPDVGIRFQPPSDQLLVNATVVPKARKQIENASVLIRHGKIVEVHAAEQGPIEAPGAEVIDLQGCFVYPAFVDPMVEMESIEMTIAAGYWNENITPQKNMSQLVTLNEDKLQSLREAGIGAALAVPTGGLIKGQSCVISTADSGLSEQLLNARGFQHIRLYPSRRQRGGYPNSPMGAVALVRQALLDAQWYGKAKRAAKAETTLPDPESNSALDSLQGLILGEQTAIFDGTNESYALRGDRLAKEFSLKAVIRGSGREYRRLDAVAAMNRTIIVPVDFPDAPSVKTRNEIAETSLQELMAWRLAPENLGMLEARNVHFVLTSDGLDSPKDFIERVRKAIEHGLSEDAALEAMTSAPAKLLGVEDRVGAVEKGKLANLLVTSGPLFDESTKLRSLWVQGNKFALDETEDLELGGIWDIELGAADASLQMKVSGEPGKAKIELMLPEEQKQPEGEDENSEGDGEDTSSNESGNISLENVQISQSQLSGTFETEGFNLSGVNLQTDGVAVIAAVLLPSGDKPKLTGTVTWPDGSASKFQAAVATEKQESGEKEEETSEGDGDKEPEATDKSLVDCTVNYPLGAFGVQSLPQQPRWLLVKNATIWTSSEQGKLENADLLIKRGVVHSVGKDLAAPKDAVVIDATGKHVSPGIIDCHSHMATDGGVNESGQAITAEVRIGDFIDPNDITIYRQLAGGVTTSNILHGSANPIGGQNQVIKLRWGALGEEMKMPEAPQGIKFALGENVKQSNFENDRTRYPQTRMGVEQILRDRFEAALSYKRKHSSWTRNPSGLPPRRDLELEAIAEILDGRRWVHCHSYKQDEILATLRVLEDYGVTIGSLQHILEGYKVADAMAAHGATGSSFSDWWAYKFEVYDAIPYNGALMHRAGVVVSFNSDDRELARHLNHEAAKAIKYGGVEPSEALKFVTLNPAKQLRIDRYVGSLEAGKHADFVIWNRSPLSTLSVCEQTWIDGRKYFDRDEDKKRQQDARKLHNELVQSIIGSGVKTRQSEDDSDPSMWWARFDEFCHHHDHDEHEDHN